MQPLYFIRTRRVAFLFSAVALGACADQIPVAPVRPSSELMRLDAGRGFRRLGRGDEYRRLRVAAGEPRMGTLSRDAARWRRGDRGSTGRARATGRQRELAVRRALGAGRARLAEEKLATTRGAVVVEDAIAGVEAASAGRLRARALHGPLRRPACPRESRAFFWRMPEEPLWRRSWLTSKVAKTDSLAAGAR